MSFVEILDAVMFVALLILSNAQLKLAKAMQELANILLGKDKQP